MFSNRALNRMKRDSGPYRDRKKHNALSRFMRFESVATSGNAFTNLWFLVFHEFEIPRYLTPNLEMDHIIGKVPMIEPIATAENNKDILELSSIQWTESKCFNEIYLA